MSILSNIDLKGILSSKTVAGLVSVAIPTVLKWAGYDLTPTDANDLVGHLVQYGAYAMEAGGWLLAFWGRLVATKQLVK